MTAESAATPAARVYLALQCAYLFPERRKTHLDDFDGLLEEFVAAARSAAEVASEVRAHASNGELYHGLKACRKLIDYEADLLQNA